MPEASDPIANPFSAQAEVDVGDEVSESHRERQEATSNTRPRYLPDAIPF